MKRLGFASTIRSSRIGYKVMIRDYNETVSYQKQLALDKVEEATTVKDIHEAPEQVQDMFERILGERNREENED
jgi:hypothetical protein